MKLQLQPRDLSLLNDLGEYGLLDTVSIQRRYWPDAETPRACQNRLKLLADNGFIKRTNLIVAAQNTLLKSGGSLPTAYALSPQGADIVEQLGHPRPKRVSRSEPGAATLLHRLEAVHARLAIDDACRLRGIPLPEWIYEQDTRPGVKLSDPIEKRHILYERFETENRHPYCRPDASCWLRIPKSQSPGEFANLIVYWEIDRDTNSPKVEMEKTFGYQALFDSHRYLEHWPITKESPVGVRVFYVCPTQARIENVVAEVRNQPISEFYRFTTHPQMTPTDIANKSIWQDVSGKRFALFGKAS